MVRRVKNTSNEDIWIDVHDDAVMTANGFPRIPLKERDSSVWSTTPAERKKLKTVKRRYKNYTCTGYTKSIKPIPCYDTLIIHVKRFDKDMRSSLPHQSTISKKCYQHQIPSILAQFKYRNEKDEMVSNVKEYRFNGKWYKFGTLPYYFGDSI